MNTSTAPTFLQPQYRDVYEALGAGEFPPYRKPDYLSASQVDTAANCGVLWYLRYGLGFKERPALAMLRGSAVHTAAETNLTQRIAGADWMRPEDAAEIAVESLRERIEAEDPAVHKDDGETIAGAVDDTAALAALDAREVAPATEPVRVEQPFTLQLNGLPPVEGYIDAIVTDPVDGRLAIRERKTSGSAPRRDRYENVNQPTLYRMAVDAAEGAEPGTLPLQVDVLAAVPLKRGTDYRHIPYALGPTTGGNRARATAAVRALAGSIEHGVFAPASPGYYLCSARYCGFHRDNGGPCPFGR